MLSLAARKALFLLFVGAFFVSAPLVVLYTAGYRFNRTNNVVSQTGTLSLASTPRGAESFVNNENMQDATPAVFQRLVPGTRTVLLSKEGYHDWERTVNVASGSTTYVTAPLFLQGTPEAIVEGTSAFARAQTTHTPEPTRLPSDIALTQTASGIEVSRTSITGSSSLLALLPLDTYTPVVAGDEDLFLENSRGEVLALSSSQARSATSVGKNVVAFAWDANERRFAWTDGLEVHIFSAATASQDLLTRQSDPITALTFAHEGESMVIASVSGITGIDLQSYVDGRMQTALASFTNAPTVWFAEDGSVAYIETLSGLSSLALTR